MNVLSLFDGMRCGRIALERAGIKVDNYYSSEIDKYAIQIANKNYPQDECNMLGDITKIDFSKLPKIDLIIGGSPCQDLSVYKFDRGDAKGLEGKKSSLFYYFEKAIKELSPTYFMLENVPMQKEWENIITDLLGVNPIIINSNLLSAADRKRLYWTNIPNITQPIDKNINLKNVVIDSNNVDEKYWYNKPFIYNGDDEKVQCTLEIKGHRHMKEVYNLKSKSNTLTTCKGGNLQKKVYQDNKCRKLTPIEYERLQTVPDNYTEGVSDSQRYNMLGNGWTVDVIAHIFSFLPDEYKEVTNGE